MQPTDTVTAALNMAHNPGANVANLYSLQAATSPFQPSVASIKDLTLAIKLTGGGLVASQSVAIDAYGDIWTANEGDGIQPGGDSVSKFAAGTGATLSPAVTGFTGGGIYQPRSVAIDSSNHVWVGDTSGSAALTNAHLSKLALDGTRISATGYDLGVQWFVPSIAIDGSGDATVALNGIIDKVNGVTGAVTQLAINRDFTSLTLAVQPTGAIWVGNSGASPGVEEFDTSGAQVFPSGAYSGRANGFVQSDWNGN